MSSEAENADKIESRSQQPGSLWGKPVLRYVLWATLLLAITGSALGYCFWFSKAARSARGLPIGAKAETVTKLLGVPLSDKQQSGDVMTCTFRFGDLSQLKCSFVRQEQQEHYTELEMQTVVTGTEMKQELSGFIPNMFGDIPTYSYREVPTYGRRLVPVDKTRMVSYWVLGGAHVAPYLRLARSDSGSPLGWQPAGAPAASTPPLSPAPSPTEPKGSSSRVDFSRGHVPQQGSAERKAIMNAARARLKTKSTFIVNAIIVSGTASVADIEPSGGGTRRLVRFDKSTSGKWKASAVRPYSSDGFWSMTGTTEDSDVTGEF